MIENLKPDTAHAMSADKGLWDRHWHLLCHRSELPERNHYLRFEILEEEVVVFHDGLDLVAFDNRCPHRGTRIFEGSFGEQRFVCPYHGWSFVKGRLFIPSKDTFRQPLDQAGLNRYRIEWVGDFMFVSRKPGQPLSVQIAGFEEILGAMSRNISNRSDFDSYTYECNWKIAVENALDQYHVSLVHKETLHRLQLNPGKNKFEGVNNAIFAEVGDTKVEKRLKTLRRFFDLEDSYQGYVSVYLFPFTFISSTFGYSYSLQQFYPATQVATSHFTSRFFEAKTKAGNNPEIMKPFFESSIIVNRQVFAEDALICSRIPWDTWSVDPPAYWCDGEEKILHFRESIAGFLRREAQNGA
jgi:phenylpropionate dioxygenase-like ring-hydroxylating dioxygenase large terminal subunit